MVYKALTVHVSGSLVMKMIVNCCVVNKQSHA